MNVFKVMSSKYEGIILVSIFFARDPQELGRLAWLSSIDEKHKVSQALIFNASATTRNVFVPKRRATFIYLSTSPYQYGWLGLQCSELLVKQKGEMNSMFEKNTERAD
jgi:hypothetical protein